MNRIILYNNNADNGMGTHVIKMHFYYAKLFIVAWSYLRGYSYLEVNGLRGTFLQGSSEKF